MNLIAQLCRLLLPRLGSAVHGRATDPADMGTAFGLDAMTTLEPHTAEEAADRERRISASRFEHRLHRRSSL